MRGVLTAHRKNVLLIALACAVGPWATSQAMPRLLPASTALTLCIGFSLAIAALSLNLLLGYAGQLSLGHAALLGVGAFAGSIVVDRWGLPMFVDWIAAALMGGLIALAIGLPALRLRGLYLALVTIVFGITMQSSVLRWNVFTHGSAGAALPRRLWGDSLVRNPAIYLSMVLLMLLVVWLVDMNVMRTKLGRAFRMIREDEVAAQSFGIDVTRYKLFAFVLSGAIAGLAGALYGHAIGLVNSDVFPLELSLRIVLIVMIGGVGKRWGIAVVAVLLGLSPKLPEFMRGYDLVVAAVVTMYNIVRLPGGLAGLVGEMRSAHRHRAPEARNVAEPAIPNFVVRDATASGGGDLLVVEGATVNFGGLMAVDDVSLAVPTRTIVGIIGPNGAGKSTLFNAISGLVPDRRGRVVLDGVDLQNLAPHARTQAGLGRTFQQVGLAVDMTVRENILLAQHMAADYGAASALLYPGAVGRVERELGALADDVIAGLGFEQYADEPVRNLSGGQRRLVELGAVLATGPKLLMLDEPTAGLSPAAAENLADRLRELRDDHGQTILLIEHNVPLVLDVCDYVYVLNAGQLLAEGEPGALARNPEVLSAYLGEVVL
jgi:ABC-type branched-subunit amino acid transport system ATPase component/ABC-type branched-subunit amino acid transport system permease subunit